MVKFFFVLFFVVKTAVFSLSPKRAQGEDIFHDQISFDKKEAKSLFASHPKKILVFADFLFQQGDYYRAISEYKRALFYFPVYEKKDLIKYMIGKSYYLGGKYRAALNYLAPLTGIMNTGIRLDTKNLIGLSYLYRKDYLGAERMFREITAEFPDISNLDTYYILIAMAQINMAFLQRKLFHNAKQSFKDFLARFPKSKFKTLAKKGILESDKAIQFSPRIVWLATSLSVILPGAGQAYNGQWSNAFVAFIFNVTLGFLAIRGFLQEDYVSGGIFSSLFITFYSGNIYQAYRSARKYNKTFFSERVEKINRAFEKYKLMDK